MYFIAVISSLVLCHSDAGSASVERSGSVHYLHQTGLSPLLITNSSSTCNFKLNFGLLHQTFHHAKSHSRNCLLDFRDIFIGLLIIFFLVCVEKIFLQSMACQKLLLLIDIQKYFYELV